MLRAAAERRAVGAAERVSGEDVLSDGGSGGAKPVEYAAGVAGAEVE